ncbi:hypothetical protein ACTXT7_016032 [Hymenolepis weldensis]
MRSYPEGKLELSNNFLIHSLTICSQQDLLTCLQILLPGRWSVVDAGYTDVINSPLSAFFFEPQRTQLYSIVKYQIFWETIDREDVVKSVDSRCSIWLQQ